MSSIIGVGGVFLKSKDPENLKKWYTETLGLPTEHGMTIFESMGKGEQTVFSIFDQNSDHFAPSTELFMLNFRVKDLVKLLADLKAKGVEQVKEMQDSEYGKFTWIMDPEGRKIELWEPAAE